MLSLTKWNSENKILSYYGPYQLLYACVTNYSTKCKTRNPLTYTNSLSLVHINNEHNALNKRYVYLTNLIIKMLYALNTDETGKIKHF